MSAFRRFVTSVSGTPAMGCPNPRRAKFPALNAVAIVGISERIASSAVGSFSSRRSTILSPPVSGSSTCRDVYWLTPIAVSPPLLQRGES